MKKKIFRLGIVADLTPNGSIHQQTFIRAVKKVAESKRFAENNIELIWENDRATFEGGAESAQILIGKNVDAVIGHYASAAAKGALPFYEKKSIPLLLPAATADFLTTKFRSALRLCGKDSDLVDLVYTTTLNKGINEIFVGNDNGIHGRALSDNIIERFSANPSVRLCEDPLTTPHIIYVGSYDNSVQFVKELEENSTIKHTIYFTDDLVHQSLSADLEDLAQKIFVYGYENTRACKTATSCVKAYHQEWNEYPNTYYLETYAAMEVVYQLFHSRTVGDHHLNKLYLGLWDTVLGTFRFNDEGESGFKRFSLWTIHDKKLISA